MINLHTETIIPLCDVRQFCPNRQNLSINTVYRWALSGIKGVRLESVMIGGRRMTSVQAVHRFFQEMSAARGGQQPTESESDSTRRAKEAGRALEAIGA